MKTCPKCKEQIQQEAIVCKHCGYKMSLSARINTIGVSLMKLGCAITVLVFFLVIVLGVII